MDERDQKMSGSGMAGYAACQGKFQLERHCPPSGSSPASEMGDRIHTFLEGGEIELTGEEMNIALRCQQEYMEIREAIGLGEPDYTTIEKRLWYGDTWSGRIDRIDHWGDDTALVVDWKTGRVGTGNSAADNLQLRAYAVLVAKNLPTLKRIFVAVVQPMAARFTIAEYDEEALALADAEIAGIVAAALEPDAPRTPSPDACKYCRGKAVCPEAGGVAKSLAVVEQAIIPQLTNDEVSDFLEKADIVEAFIDAVRAEAKQRLKDGQEIAGRKLQAGRTSRSIEDLSAAHEKLAEVIGADAFLSACKVSVPTLEKAFVEAKSLKGKAGKEAFELAVAEILVNKTSEPSMVRSK
jgi:CRISPR/Cas system-associated exonuclease Cas4 (RecB family)